MDDMTMFEALQIVCGLAESPRKRPLGKIEQIDKARKIVSTFIGFYEPELRAPPSRVNVVQTPDTNVLWCGPCRSYHAVETPGCRKEKV